MANPPRPSDDLLEPADMPGVTEALGRNIEAIARRRDDYAANASGGVKLSTKVGALIGQMGFVYAHLAALAVYTAINLGQIPFIAPFDGQFYLLGTIASVEGFFVAIVILITQNHDSVANNRRDDLNLQVSMLAEHELSALIKLTIAIADKLGLDAGQGAIADLQHDIHPDDVLDTIQAAEDARKG